MSARPPRPASCSRWTGPARGCGRRRGTRSSRPPPTRPCSAAPSVCTGRWTPPGRCSGRCSRSPCCSRCRAATTRSSSSASASRCSASRCSRSSSRTSAGRRRPGQQRATVRAVGRLLRDRRVLRLVVVAGLLAWSPSRRLRLPQPAAPAVGCRPRSSRCSCWPARRSTSRSRSRSAGWPTGSAAAPSSWPGTSACWSLYVLLLAPVPGWLACAGCLPLLGAYYAATDGVLSAAAAEILPASLRTSGLALVQTAVAGGRLLSSLLFGLLWTVTGGSRGASPCSVVALLGRAAASRSGCSSRGRPAMVAVTEPGVRSPAAGCVAFAVVAVLAVAGGGVYLLRRGDGRATRAAAGRRGRPRRARPRLEPAAVRRGAAPRAAQHRARSLVRQGGAGRRCPTRTARARWPRSPASGCTRCAAGGFCLSADRGVLTTYRAPCSGRTSVHCGR